MWDENIERHCVKLWKSADTVFVLTQFQHDRQKVVFSARKQCQNYNMSCKRVVYLNVFMSIVDVHDMSRRRRHRIDMATSTTRHRCTKTRNLNAKMPTSRTHVLCTTAFLRRQRRRDIMPSAMSRCRWRHIVVVSRRTTRHAMTTDKTILCSQKLSISLFC